MHKSGTSCSAKWKEIKSWREEKKETGVHRDYLKELSMPRGWKYLNNLKNIVLYCKSNDIINMHESCMILIESVDPQKKSFLGKN